MLCEYITLMFCASQSWWNSLRRKPKHAKIACVGAITGQDDIPGIVALLYAGLSTWHQVTTLKLLLNVRVLYPYTIFSSHLQKNTSKTGALLARHTHTHLLSLTFQHARITTPVEPSCETLPSPNREKECDVCEIPCQGFSLHVERHVGETKEHFSEINC